MCTHDRSHSFAHRYRGIGCLHHACASEYHSPFVGSWNLVDAGGTDSMAVQSERGQKVDVPKRKITSAK
jgi:hypothetical protein